MRSSKVTIAVRDCVFFLSLIGIISLFTVCVHDAAGAEFRIVPAVTLSEEYNDNVFLAPTNRSEDYITMVRPTVTIAYHTAFWTWDLDYAFEYYSYLRKSRSDDTTHTMDLRNRTELIDNFFFFEGRDQYQRVSASVTRDYTLESQFINQTERTWITLNPYVVFRSGSSFTPIAGYKYDALWYNEASTIDTVDHIGYLEMTTPLTSNLTFTVGTRYTQDYNIVQNYYKIDLYAGLRYSYAPGSFAYCTLGKSEIHYAGDGVSNHMIWDAGIVHRYSTFTLSFITTSDYIHDPTTVLRRLDTFVTTLTKSSTARTSLSGSLAYYEYRDPVLNNLVNDTYQVTAIFRHAIIPGLTLTAETTNSAYQDYVLAEKTYVFLWGVGIERAVKPDLNFTASYWFTHSYSPDSYFANYDNNRISVGLNKRF